MRVSVDEAVFAALERRTGLDFKGVVNEALSIYQRAVAAREDGRDIAVVDETNHSFSVLETPGLKNVHPAVIHQPQIGDVMPAGHAQAGWIYMGPDDETGKDFYAAPKDESGTFTFNQAAKHAASSGAKVPTQSQLDKMYMSRDKGALKDTFNVTGSDPASWYWSSRDVNFLAWAQRFSDGYRFCNFMNVDSSLRLVR